MWHVYVLRSKKDSKLYIGSTNDINRRLSDHNTGKVESTKPRAPFALEACITVQNETKARSLEKYFKTGSGHALLNKRIL